MNACYMIRRATMIVSPGCTMSSSLTSLISCGSGLPAAAQDLETAMRAFFGHVAGERKRLTHRHPGRRGVRPGDRTCPVIVMSCPLETRT